MEWSNLREATPGNGAIRDIYVTIKLNDIKCDLQSNQTFPDVFKRMESRDWRQCSETEESGDWRQCSEAEPLLDK